MLPSGDAQLVQLTDAALADAAQRGGLHLFCHAGCTPCCHGAFEISSLDAARLQAGLSALEKADPAQAASLQQRIDGTRQRLAPDFPGNTTTGQLATGDISKQHFQNFADDEPCPVLNSDGTCALYAYRPMTCRVFGPPVRSEDGLGTCELCFQAATEDEIVAAEMYLPDPALETALTAETGDWTTIVEFAFFDSSSDLIRN